jgi:4,5-dihydroxyphthalate decarboxylase
VRLDDAPAGATISALLEAGEIDAFIAPRRPKLADKDHPHIGWLFTDPAAAAEDYFRRTGFFPIMHLLGIRRELAERHPWLPGAVFKAFVEAKRLTVQKLAAERLPDARALMGEDFWSYGVAPNRKVLDYFLAQHHAQGLSARRLSVDELFHPATYETFKV